MSVDRRAGSRLLRLYNRVKLDGNGRFQSGTQQPLFEEGEKK